MMNHWPYTCAFVLKFRSDAEPGAGPFEGRVEHVASGRSAQFRTPEELRAIVAQLLAEVRAQDAESCPDQSRGPGLRP